MEHGILQRLAELRAKAYRLMWLFSLSTVIGSVVLVAVVCGLLDYLLRFEGVLLRWLSSLVVLGTLVGTIFWVYYQRSLLVLDDLTLAQHLQRQYPVLAERLASAVEFLKQPEADLQAGSPGLRRAVIHQASASIEHLNFEEVLEPRPTVRRTMLAASICLLATLLAVFFPQSVALAGTRLIFPWEAKPWPLRNELAFVDAPNRVARGQPLEFRVKSPSGTLPSVVWLERIYYDAASSEVSIQRDRMQLAEKGIMYLRLDAVIDPFSYRVYGGDHLSMPYQELELVDPPEILELEVTLTPPKYTQLAKRTVQPHFEALLGTHVHIEGESSKELQAAIFRQEGAEDRPAVLKFIDGELNGFEVDFTVTQSGSYWFRLEGEEGFIGGDDRRFEMRGIPDTPPEVILEEPVFHLAISPEAQVPLRVAVRDDLAIQDIAISYTRNQPTSGEEQRFVLYQGPTTPASQPQRSPTGERQVVEQVWDLKQLDPPLEPGTEILFFATASDYQPLSNQSQSRRLTIISSDQVLERLANRQGRLLEALQRILRLQQEARSETRSVQIQYEEVKSLAAQDRDHLQSAELTQREVEQSLFDEQHGVTQLIRQLLEELNQNRVEDQEIERRMQGLLEVIGQLGSGPLAEIRQRLTEALKVSQEAAIPTSDDGTDPLLTALTTTTKQQGEVIQVLESLLEELSQWNDARQFRHELRRIQTKQEELAKESAELLPRTLTKNFEDLSPHHQAALRQNASKQQDLARELSRLLQTIQKTIEEMEGEQPELVQRLSDALEEAQQLVLPGGMREAAQEVGENNIAQATQRQRALAKELQELLDILSNRTESDLTKRIEQLSEVETFLQQLRQRQEEVQKQLEQSNGQPSEKLQAEQQRIQQEAERLTRKLQRLQAEETGDIVNEATQEMQESQQASAEGNADQATKQAQQATEKLKEAEQQLTQQKQEAEAELAYEELLKTKDLLIGLRDRQASLGQETIRLEEIRQETGELTTPQRTTLADLAATQRILREELGTIAENLRESEVFYLALTGAMAEMEQATILLQNETTGRDTQTAQANALRRLEQLLASFENDPGDQENQEGQPGEQPAGQENQQGPPSDGLPALAQVKLLRLLQEEINERTLALESRLGTKQQLSEAEQQEYERLSLEQGKLADILLNLAWQAAAQAEEGESE
ncbi:Hypothetical protein PBC10988_13280 [Planctomycetales bacterium 10988]|nr:Hypothetical protein PBC10988_13280 [Planctomycetales bacterium 10988]